MKWFRAHVFSKNHNNTLQLALNEAGTLYIKNYEHLSKTQIEPYSGGLLMLKISGERFFVQFKEDVVPDWVELKS